MNNGPKEQMDFFLPIVSISFDRLEGREKKENEKRPPLGKAKKRHAHPILPTHTSTPDSG